MAIFRQAANFYTDTPSNVTTYTLSGYDPGYAGTEKGRIIFVPIINGGSGSPGGSTVTATYGGVQMNSTYLQPTVSFDAPPGLTIFYIINPPTGAQNIVFTRRYGVIDAIINFAVVAYYSDTDISFRLGTVAPTGYVGGGGGGGETGLSTTKTVTALGSTSWLFALATNFNSASQTLSFSEFSGPRTAPTTADDATVGTLAWVPSGGGGSNLIGVGVPTGSVENSIKLVKGGAISGNEKSTGAALTGVATLREYGGSADLHGLAWTPADINASDFGVVVSYKRGAAPITHYLKATNFGFNIPTGATINGIKAGITALAVFTQGFTIFAVTSFQMTVYYTSASGPAYVTGAGNPSDFQVIDSGTEIPQNSSITVTSTVGSSEYLYLLVLTFLPIRRGMFWFME